MSGGGRRLQPLRWRAHLRDHPGSGRVRTEGQTDAAKALGLTFWPRMAWVILPQALPIILPPWVNTAVEMVKGTLAGGAGQRQRSDVRDGQGGRADR